MGWTNQQAETITGLAFTYLAATVLYSTGSSLTLDSGATFASATDLDISDAEIEILRTVTDPTGANGMLRFRTSGIDNTDERIIDSRRDTDGTAPFAVWGRGRMAWAGTTRDVFLERTAAALLTLTGSLNIGTNLQVGGVDRGRGYVTSASSTSSSAPVGNTSTTVLTVSHTWEAGRAYRFSFGTNAESSLAGALCRFRLQATSSTGTVIWDWGDWRTEGANDINVGGEAYLCRTGTDLSRTIVLTLITISTGETTTYLGSAFRPRYLLVEDVGSASDYSFANLIS
jgi:hypothetical protein